MPKQCAILFALFSARMAMAFQFQSVAALSPQLLESGSFDIADVGLLIGSYLGPGVVVAFCGGMLAARFCGRGLVAFSLCVMIAGNEIVAMAPSLNVMIGGRVFSGIGGVIVNVALTKLVLDWFSDRNSTTAMAVFLSSWPVGIALALLTLPTLAEWFDVSTAWRSVTGFLALILIAFVATYRDPEASDGAEQEAGESSVPWFSLALAALVWGLFSSAVALVFSFSPAMLADKGLSIVSAGSIASLFMIAIMVVTPIGGWMSDRYGVRAPMTFVSMSIAVLTLLVLASLPGDRMWVGFIILGCAVGLSPSLIVSLLYDVLPPLARALGSGAYYSIFYLLMTITPPGIGILAGMSGRASYPVTAAAFVMLGGLVAFWVLLNKGSGQCSGSECRRKEPKAVFSQAQSACETTHVTDKRHERPSSASRNHRDQSAQQGLQQ